LSKKLSFKISSALKSVIGRDLITDDFVAIFELVKNSFDAAATRVDIVFQENNGVLDRIYVVDNGKGMSYDDLANKWLFVAYSAKSDGTEDKQEKVYAGNKGVGRFSCDRLGGKLRIQTKVKNNKIIDVLNVNWGDFERDPKELFSKIDVIHDAASSFDIPDEIKHPDHGVVIEVSNIRAELSWDRAKQLRLKQHLAKLIDPFGDDNSNISIYIHSDAQRSQDGKVLEEHELGCDIKSIFTDEGCFKGLEETPSVVNGPINNFIFDTLKEKTTWLHTYIDNDGFIYSDLVDRGALIYRIRESSNIYPELKDSGFNCQLFYLNQSAKLTFKRRMGIRSVDFGSLFLFRNGFRVYSTGEPGDDSWKIDKRRAQGHSRYLGARDVLGKVDISGSELKFKESSSRDKGLIKTQAAEELFECVTHKCLRRIEKYVVGVTWGDVIDKTYDTPQRLSLAENRTRIIKLISTLSSTKDIEILEYNKDLVGLLSEKSKYFEASLDTLTHFAGKMSDDDLQKNIAAAKKKFEELKKSESEALALAEKEAEARRIAELAAAKERSAREQAEQDKEKVGGAYEAEKKRNLFLLSNDSRDKEQLENFMHQIIIYAAESKQRITNEIYDFNNLSPEVSINKNKVVDILSDLLESNDKIITTSRFATSANFMLDSAQVEADLSTYVQDYLEKICAAYTSRINISVENTAKEFFTRFTPIELGMVFDNLVNNAKKSRSSQIKFLISTPEKGILEINVVDNGKGLSRNLVEPGRVFEKGVTTTDGSGLGLYYCRHYVEKLGGDIVLTNPQPQRGAGFTIRFRK